MYRLTDPGEIEGRLLALAHQTDAALTPPTLAYYAPCSIADAERVLEGLAGRGVLTMEVRDDGTIVYALPGRQPLALGQAQAASQPATTALVPVVRERHASPLAAVLLSVWIPGAGHLYAGRAVSALLWFVAVGMGYALILPGIVLHMFCIASAAAAARRAPDPVRALLPPGGTRAAPDTTPWTPSRA